MAIEAQGRKEVAEAVLTALLVSLATEAGKWLWEKAKAKLETLPEPEELK